MVFLKLSITKDLKLLGKFYIDLHFSDSFVYCKDRWRTWKTVYSESLIKITSEALQKFELV